MNTPSSILHTRYLPPRLKHSLAVGLEARHDELVAYRNVGYNPGAADQRIAALLSDTRQAYALGLLSYLPAWAK